MTDRSDKTPQESSEEMFKHALENALASPTHSLHPDLSLTGQMPVPKIKWQIEQSPAPAKAGEPDSTAAPTRPKQADVAPSVPAGKELPTVAAKAPAVQPAELSAQAPARKPLEESTRPAVPPVAEQLPRTKGDLHMKPAAPAATDNVAEIPESRTGVAWTKHEDHLKRAQQGNISTIFYGDSITEAMSIGDGFKETFGKNAENFGVKGDSTQHLLWRMQNGETSIRGAQPEKGVILIGTNNLEKGQSDQDIARGIIKDLDEATTRLPNTKFLVLGILPRGHDRSDPLRAHVAAINKEVQSALAARPDLAGKVSFKDIGPQMLEPDGSMSTKVWEKDWEHPTLGGYDRKKQQWVADTGNHRLFSTIKPLLDAL